MLISIGITEILLPIVVITSIWLVVKLVKKVSRIEDWIAKHFQARFLASPGTVKVAHRAHFGLRWLPLPFALIALIASYVIGIAWVFIASVRSQGNLPSWVNLVFSAVAGGFLIIGLLIHFRPAGDRKVKYEFLVAGTAMLSAGFLYLITKIISFSVQTPRLYGYGGVTLRPDLEPRVALWVIISHVVYIVVLQIVFSLCFGPPSTEEKTELPSPTIRRYYSLVRRAGYVFALISFSGLTQPLLTAYLILRYVLGERMSSAPILYLRSFHYVAGPTAFGKIVARVAARYGVLLALVHQAQRPLELHAETRLTERAELAKVPDETWQQWIEEQMVRASAIIIDYSVDTQGLAWELDRAVGLVDSSKILVLNRKGVVIRTPPNVWKLEYEMGQEGEEQARGKLNEHLRTMLLAS